MMIKSKLFSDVLIILMAGLLAFAGPVVTVHADALPTSTASAQSQPQSTPAMSHPLLQAGLKLENDWLNRQSENITRMNDTAGKVQTKIDQLDAKGVDTSALVAALAAFNAQMPAINASHATATQILGGHAGFDAAGNVTNVDLAKTTLADARSALKDAHSTMIAAAQALKQAVQAFRSTLVPHTTSTPVS
jgi:hypothetical protein